MYYFLSNELVFINIPVLIVLLVDNDFSTYIKYL